MNSKHAFSDRLKELQSWRSAVTAEIQQVSDTLRETQFLRAEDALKLAKCKQAAAAERVTLVFIAEIARGKSELINAIVFSDLGRRFLPSGLGRTTRCVTELRFDRDIETGVRCLPIETRESSRSFAELSLDQSQWHLIPFDADKPKSVAAALATLSETRFVSMADAVAWGLHNESSGKHSASKSGDGMQVEVARWRHAIVNFPHPLLDSGLVILDTPGLAAFLAEPELARNRLPNADAALLVLDVGEDMTKRDLAAWREYMGGGRIARGPLFEIDEDTAAGNNTADDAANGIANKDTSKQVRLVVLNKIDDLDIDTTRPRAEANREMLLEIDRRVHETADLLRVDPINVVPISAKLGLVGKLANDKDKTLRSRIYHLERDLATKLPRDRQQAMTEDISNVLSGALQAAQTTLDHNRFETLEALSALVDVRAKNDRVMAAIIAKTATKQERVVETLKELKGIKAMQTKLGEELAEVANVASAKRDIERTKKTIIASIVPATTLDAVAQYFAVTEKKLAGIDQKIDEIRTLFADVGKKLRSDFGLTNVRAFDVHPFPTQRFHTEFAKAREAADDEFSKTSNLVLKRGSALAKQFDELVGTRVQHIFEIAQRETTTWVRGLYKAIERPLEDARTRLEHTVESIEKVKSAELDLAERIAELQGNLDVIKLKHSALAEARGRLEKFIEIAGKPI
jgi:exonuclease VII small subunit